MKKKTYLLALWGDNAESFEECSLLCFESESKRDEVASDAESRGFLVCCDEDFI